MARPKSNAKTTKSVKENKEISDIKTEKYKCMSCGEEWNNPAGHFYKATHSPLWESNNNYCPICETCLTKKFESISQKYKDDSLAMMVICHYMDIPFIKSLFDSIIAKNEKFSIGRYTRIVLNNTQTIGKTFVDSIISGELKKDEQSVNEEKEERWTASDKKVRDEVIKIVGYDPFEGYNSSSRKFLFNELVKYFDEDTTEDNFKLSQIIQLVNNNNQIRNYDLQINRLNPLTDSSDIMQLNNIKNTLVKSNDKIAKENEISVKNRSNKEIGKSTLTYLQKYLRELDFKDAEVNYYNQLTSEGTLWAINMSNKSILENGMFDENDKQEIFATQRELIQTLQKDLDDSQEKYRLLLIEYEKLKKDK